MAESSTPEIAELLARVDDLECAVAELRADLDGLATANDQTVTLLPGLVVYYPDDDHGNVIVVAASSRRLPMISVPPRPTVREWAGVLHHLKKWPGDIAERVENLLLRVIDPYLDGLPIDLLDAATIEDAVGAARLTDEGRVAARQLLEFAVTEAVANGKAPAL